jgi:hypothetical protein
MSPPDNGGTGGPSEDAAPAPPGIRLRKTLGAAGIMIGSGLIIVTTFLESLNGVRFWGIISAQAVGNLAGFVILLTGALLYMSSAISHMEHRHRGLERRLESILEASGKGPDSGPGSAPETSMEKVAAAPAPAADQTGQAANLAEDVPDATEPLPAAGVAAGTAAEPSPAPGEKKEKTAAPAPVARPTQPETAEAAPAFGTNCPVCGSGLTAGVCRHCITSASIQSAYQELSRTQELGASVEEAAALLGNARNSLEENDYLQAGDYVRSSKYLLEISAKTYFALRSAVEKAEAERKKLEDSGLDTTELSSKLSDVRSAIVRGEYQEAKTILDGERRTASDLRLPYFQRPARTGVVEQARVHETPERAAPPERPVPGQKPVTEEKPVPGERLVLEEKPVPEVKPVPEQEPVPKQEPAPEEGPAAISPAAEPAASPPTSPSQTAVPKFSSGISACPKCGRKTMKGWKKCPHCLTALT